MAALSKFQPVSGNSSLFYGATTIASVFFVAAFVNIVRKRGKIFFFQFKMKND